MHLCGCGHVSEEARGRGQTFFSIPLRRIFWDGIQLTLGSLIWLGWMPSELQGSSCLCLQHDTQTFTTMIDLCGWSCSPDKHFTD